LRQVEVLVDQGMARIDAIGRSVLPNRRIIVGKRRTGRTLTEAAWDPKGVRIRL